MAKHLNAIVHRQFAHIAGVTRCSNEYTALHLSQGGAVQIARNFGEARQLLLAETPIARHHFKQLFLSASCAAGSAATGPAPRRQ